MKIIKEVQTALFFFSAIYYKSDIVPLLLL